MLLMKDVAAAENGIALAAGRDGLDRPVIRTHMVESLEIADGFIARGELVFTTGAGLSGEGDLLALAKTAEACGACGLVVNFGPYIREIGRSVTAFADAAGFPLFTCPWEVRMAEIMHRVACAVEDGGQSDSRLAAAFREVLLHRAGVSLLRRLGLRESSSLYVAVLSARPQASADVYAFEIDGLNAAVAVDADPEALRALCPGGGAAVSAPADLASLGRAYSEARRLYLLGKGAPGVRFLEESGVCQLLLGADRALLQRYCRASLDRLAKGGAGKRAGLLDALEAYLRCGGSLKEASAELGLHKNTVTNRVRRCGELLGVDIAQPQVRVDLSVALLARRVLELPD